VGRRFVDVAWIAKRMQFRDDRINRALAKIAAKEQDMDRALATIAPTAPAVTPEQFELIRRTIAKDATPDELQLYLHDCARQHVHPLDKLIHFTKRNGKYTPITSIDFFRIRAAETGECIGSDDATFTGTPSTASFEAHVTVYRLVQGQRAPFTATARWTEYKPDQDFMWKRMPHLMLAKCAEALALRKAFPKQLSGLYVKEEMEQASSPAPARSHARARPHDAPIEPDRASPADRLSRPFEPPDDVPRPAADMNQPVPDAWKPFVRTEAVTGIIVGGKRSRTTGKTTATLAGGAECWTLDHDVAKAVIAYKENQTPVTITVTDDREIVTLAEATDAAF
jgi:phage recombination protein Bet